MNDMLGGTVRIPSASDAEAATSAVSWGAILAGAAGAAALAILLMILGTGLGLASVSPWAMQGAGATAIGVSTILWLTLTQLLSAGMGGYLAGRLRSRWLRTHTDEVFFRDTAHGFLSWAVALLVTFTVLASAVGSGLRAGAEVAGSTLGAVGTTAATAAGGAAAAKGGGDAASGDGGYFVDALFRSSAAPAPATADANGSAAPSPQGNAAPPTAEVGRILARGLANGALNADDTQYLAQLVAQRTGLAPQDAQKRVTDVYNKALAGLRDAETKARAAADQARKAAAYAALWAFVSLLMGAFVASLMATFGGRQRDL